MDAAQSGDAEFRKEVRKAINEGRGPALIAALEEMQHQCEGEEKQSIEELLHNVKQWVADPSGLEEGGRFLGFHRYGGMFSRLFGGYYPYRYGYGYGSYYGGYYPSYYGGCYTAPPIFV